MSDVPQRRLIEDGEEKLHRQVHPRLVDDDQPSWQVFCPMPKDEGELSVSANSVSTAEVSCRNFIERGFQSCGVLTVTVTECVSESLNAYLDPLGDDDPAGPDDAHAIIDFNGLSSNSKRKRAGKALLAMSVDRGWSFRVQG